MPEKSDLIAVIYHWASSLRLSLESESLILPSPGHTYIRDYLNTIRFKLQIDSHYVPRLHPTPSSSLQMRLEEREKDGRGRDGDGSNAVPMRLAGAGGGVSGGKCIGLLGATRRSLSSLSPSFPQFRMGGGENRRPIGKLTGRSALVGPGPAERPKMQENLRSSRLRGAHTSAHIGTLIRFYNISYPTSAAARPNPRAHVNRPKTSPLLTRPRSIMEILWHKNPDRPTATAPSSVPPVAVGPAPAGGKFHICIV